MFVPPTKGIYTGFLNRETEECHFDDPRLGQLPKGWVKEKDRHWYLFINKQTGEKTRFDPRMTIKELTKQGIKLKELYLV
jgi:hypothetical protein